MRRRSWLELDTPHAEGMRAMWRAWAEVATSWRYAKAKPVGTPGTAMGALTMAAIKAEMLRIMNQGPIGFGLAAANSKDISVTSSSTPVPKQSPVCINCGKWRWQHYADYCEPGPGARRWSPAPESLDVTAWLDGCDGRSEERLRDEAIEALIESTRRRPDV